MVKGSEDMDLDFHDSWLLSPTPNTTDNDVSLVNLEKGEEKRIKTQE